MQGQPDAAHFIQSFTGSHHFVLDYLVEEVLRQQPETIQAFLLRTSILDRMCGSLCDAVLQSSFASGQETLEYLERANLFIVPLDNERHWYRYHHLFGDLLRQRLENPRNSPNSTCAPASGMKRTATRARRSTMPSQPGNLSGRQGWLKRPGRAWIAVSRPPFGWAG